MRERSWKDETINKCCAWGKEAQKMKTSTKDVPYESLILGHLSNWKFPSTGPGSRVQVQVPEYREIGSISVTHTVHEEKKLKINKDNLVSQEALDETDLV
jgi:hypothetical protein